MSLEDIFKDDLIMTSKELLKKYGLKKCGEAWTEQGKSGFIEERKPDMFRPDICDTKNIYK